MTTPGYFAVKAVGLRAKGSCDKALVLYKSVLATNPRVKDATDGAAKCQQGLVPTSME